MPPVGLEEGLQASADVVAGQSGIGDHVANRPSALEPAKGGEDICLMFSENERAHVLWTHGRESWGDLILLRER